MPRHNFRSSLFVALTWLVGVALYAAVRVGPDAEGLDALLRIVRPLEVVQMEPDMRGTALPIRWMHQRW